MKKGILVVLVILLSISCGIGAYYIISQYNNKENDNIINNDNSDQNESINNENQTNNKQEESYVVDETKLESVVKKTLIEKIGKSEDGPCYKEDGICAEGHKILRYEIKDNKIFAYVLAEIVLYISENGKYNESSGQAGPITMIFDIENDYYKIYEVKQPANGASYDKSLKEMFPYDLINKTKENYNTDFYQNQIKTYLK